MNERLTEIAKEALVEHCISHVRLEHFAELIIRECADIGERYANGNYEVYNQILKHFGVEDE